MPQRTTVLIFGATGMIGHMLIDQLGERDNLTVYGAMRARHLPAAWFTSEQAERLIPGTDVNDWDSVTRAVYTVKPAVVINCIGLTKRLKASGDPLAAIT